MEWNTLTALTALYNQWAKGRTPLPRLTIEVGQDFYDRFEQQIQAQVRVGKEPTTEDKYLAFKTAKLRATGPGWYVKFVENQ